jgi:hypothetical protein
MVKIVSGGGIKSRVVSHTKAGKQEPKSKAMSPGAVDQLGQAVAFKKPPLVQGRGYEPKGPTSNLGQGPGANRVIHPSGSQQKTPPAQPMEKGTDILSQYGPEATGKR